MSRYTSTPIITTPDQPKRRYINVKYPEITRDFADIYVYASLGDRYDLIANSYYNDTELWWIILRANPNQPADSLYPNPGDQIRIPAPFRIPNILAQYDSLNQNI